MWDITKVSHILCHNASLNKSQKIEIKPNL